LLSPKVFDVCVQIGCPHSGREQDDAGFFPRPIRSRHIVAA
jgi:hypothetical protein